MLNEIHAFGMYEACIGVEHGDFVIDVGAHIGSFTIDSAKKAGPSGLVVALEPSSENFQLLSENVSCNSLSNVRLMNLAAGAEEGAANLNIYEPVANSLHMRDRKRTGTERVAVRTLDSLVKELALERVDYLKINVEGHELEVLNGAPTILTDFHPSLILEMHNFGPSESQLRTLLSQFYDKLEKKGSLLFSSRLPRSMN